MSKWNRAILNEVTVKVTDGAHYSPKEYLDGNPMFSVKDMREQGFHYENAKTISDANYNKLIESGCQPEIDDVLIAKDGSVLKHIFRVKNQPDYVLLSSIAIIRPNKTLIDPDFLVYVIKEPATRDLILNNFVGGSGVPRIVLKDFKLINIPLPPLPEQKAIAEVLSSLDDKIDLLHRQNKTLESMAETLFRQWFVEEAKEEWEWHQIGEYIEVLRGLSYKGAGLSDKGNGIPMHNLNSVYEGGGYKYEGIKYYSGDFKDRHRIYPGDIIITNTEQGHDMLLIGYPAIIPSYFGKEGIFSQHIYKLELKDDTLTKPFVYYLLMIHDVREQISGATNGSTVNMLAKNGIEWARFKLPPKQKIDSFTEFAIPLLEKQETNIMQIKNLENMRDTLLPKLMSGEVRVE